MLSPYMSPVERIWFYSLRILCALILLFLILPVLVIIPLSFNSGSFLVYPLQGFSLHWYQDFFASAEWMRALKNSVIVAPAATVLAMVFGTLAAIGLTRGDFPGKALVMALVISPMVVPVVIIGVASYLFFAPLGLGNSYFSLIVVHAVLGVPFVIITVSATLQGFNHNRHHHWRNHQRHDQRFAGEVAAGQTNRGKGAKHHRQHGRGGRHNHAVFQRTHPFRRGEEILIPVQGKPLQRVDQKAARVE